MILATTITSNDNWKTLAAGPDFDLWLDVHVMGNEPQGLAPQYTTDMREAWKIGEKLHMLVSPSLMGNWCAGVFRGVQGMSPSREGDARYAEEGTWVERENAQMAICCSAFRVAVKLGPGEHEIGPPSPQSLVKDILDKQLPK